MMPTNHRLALLQANSSLLVNTLRGIEKEGLRVDRAGKLALTPHPKALGSALSNPAITTDYSEALLELITETHQTTDSLLAELQAVHYFVSKRIDDEFIWSQSMPAWLPPTPDIPIGWYGTSNSGMLKHVYRRGLAERYGKPMQCIAGLHYNFSLDDAIWHLFDDGPDSLTAKRSKGYLALIRNFTRFSWLLMYLFGASPATSDNFLRGVNHQLQKLDSDTWYSPYATSLRMTGLGYNNKENAQAELQMCYNDLETFVQRIYEAVTTPWPEYEAIGTHRNGEWIQLNPNIIQIENEYYSSIRPKRTTASGERPATALAERGVEYIEVRCLDLDPFSPLGISQESCKFLDTFLLFCATEPSAWFPNNGYCQDSHDNFSLVAEKGRDPKLRLIRQNKTVGLREWAYEILEAMQPYAELLDTALNDQGHSVALAAQRAKVKDADLTPSGQLLQNLRDTGLTLHEYTLQQSAEHKHSLLTAQTDPAAEAKLAAIAEHSLQEQIEIEASDTESFDDFVARYHAQLKRPLLAN